MASSFVVLVLFCLQAYLGAAVLVPNSQLLTASHAVRYSNDWAVQVEGNPEAVSLIASANGFINMGQIGNLEGYYHFQLNVSHEAHRDRNLRHLTSRSIGSLSEIRESPDLSAALGQHEGVRYVKQQTLLKRVLNNDYTPPTDPNWKNQWSLLNNGSFTNGPSGKDLNVEPAWMQGITGSGSIVAIVDNGLEKGHRDLSVNYNSRASYDFLHYDSDPTPDNYHGDDPDSHGTECAGVVGMAKNQFCGVGVAYESSIGGIKFNVSAFTDITEAGMFSHENSYIQVYSNSWGPLPTGFIVDGPRTLGRQAIETAAAQGRNGKGSIYVWASGNGGWNYDSCAADGYVASIYTIAVGSADQNGGQAAYDENCPGKMAVTFSYNSNTFPEHYDDNWDPYNQVSTTTLNGECTDGFTGTSSSTPMVSATIALVLQANSKLTWRDVQYLIAYTSNRDKLVGGEWFTNGGGLKVSPKFGFGAIDAEAMVTRARRWKNVPPQQSAIVQPSSSSGVDQHITSTFDVTSFSANSISFLEHVVVTMSLELSEYGTEYDYSDYYDYKENHGINNIHEWLQDPHPRRGDIQITLTSPQGTVSTLLPYRLYDFINKEGYINWPFMSVHHWGENPVGTWTLVITFKSQGGILSMTGLNMKLYGTTTTPRAVSNIPLQCDSACQGACSGPGPENCDICKKLRVAQTLECVSSCPNGTTLYKNYCLGTRITTMEIIIISGAVGGACLVAFVLCIVIIAIAARKHRKSGRNYQFQPLHAVDSMPTAV